MKCQLILWGKSIISMSSAEFAHVMVSVKKKKNIYFPGMVYDYFN